MKDIISFSDFTKLELVVGTVAEAAPIPDSNKLLKLLVDVGSEKRQIIAGIQKSYAAESLIGKQIVIVANLEPRSLAGLPSQGMLLAAHGENGLPILLQPEKLAPNGSAVS